MMQNRELPRDAESRLQAWYEQLLQKRHRSVLWCDEDNPAHAWLPRLLRVWPTPQVALGAGNDLQAALSGVQQRDMSQARSMLGQEAALVVVDARTGIDPDALGAISGILTAGGLLVLITATEALASRFGQRLYRLLKGSDVVMRSLLKHFDADTTPNACPIQAGPTSEQQAVIARVLQLPVRSPLVITALRGRGKTAALGMAAAALLARGEREIWVSAPRAAAVTPLFTHLAATCPEGVREGNQFHTASGRVRFMAPDAIERHDTHHETPPVLLVDEAAALPVSYLQCWLAQFPRLVLATTLQGYEGNGQGFAHTIARRLSDTCLTLKTPIRWAADDPLERWIADVVCLGVTPQTPVASEASVVIERLDRDRLLQDDAQVRAVFGLLTHAHYRTTPRDVMTLLDHPRVSLWGAWRNHTLVGVVACFDEGGLEAPLAEQVAAGTRRTQGHLLAQTLTLHTGMPRMAQARWRRITRIAVHPDVHRQRIGTRLMHAVEAEAEQQGIALMGASFGGTAPLIAFWQALGYQPVRVGLKADKVTGERAVIVAKDAMSSHDVNVNQLRRHFLTQLPYLTAFELNALAPEIVAALLIHAADHTPPLSDEELVWLRRVGEAHAPIASARPVLQRAFLIVGDHLQTALRAGAVGVLFQGRDMRWLAAQQQLAGQRGAEQWLRQQVVHWLTLLQR